MSLNRAVAYCRSSKDRSDVSIAAQRHDLEALAKARGLTIARWYEDAVQSGSTEDRPAFSELISDIKNASRGWSTLLVLDTSRIARGRYIAQAFRHECKRRGVELVVAKMPETDPVSAVILEAVLEAMDEVHSIMSREKGLAGMRENVRRGWRAGGRAPWGYALEHEATDAIRDGKPVMKSRLVLSADADKARRFLSARADGVPRIEASRSNSVDVPVNSLIDVEWNALVYAGHTVWNRHHPKKARGAGRPKRRDRSEWVVKRDTHPALITDAQAEAILVQLQTSDMGRRVSEAKSAGSSYLLSGVMVTSDGRPWVGAGVHYRLKPGDGGVRGKRVPRAEVDQMVIARVRDELRDGDLVSKIAQRAKEMAAAESNRTAPVLAEIARLEKRKQRAAMLALDPSQGDTFLPALQDLTRQINALRHEADAIAREDKATAAIRTITPTAVREAILGLDSDRALVTALVSRVVLDADMTGRIEYGLSLASPRRTDRWAAPVSVSKYRLAV